MLRGGMRSLTACFETPGSGFPMLCFLCLFAARVKENFQWTSPSLPATNASADVTEHPRFLSSFLNN